MRRSSPRSKHAHLELLWGQRLQPQRGPRPTSSLERLVSTAVALADAEGLAAVSMERVAKELGLTTMALYRYVSGKQALVALMIDVGVGPPPRLSGSWRRRLTAWATALFETFARHPWCLEATGAFRVMGPNELAWLEAGMAALAPTKLSVGERHGACVTLLGVVRTAAQFAASRELSRAEWTKATRAALVGRADYPQLTELLRAPPVAPLAQSLDWVLDGIAERLQR